MRHISSKIACILLMTGFVTLVFAFIIWQLFVFPNSRNIALNDANANMKLLMFQAEAEIDLSAAYASSIASNHELKGALLNFIGDASQINREKVMKALEDKLLEFSKIIGISIYDGSGLLFKTSQIENLVKVLPAFQSEFQNLLRVNYSKVFFTLVKQPQSKERAWEKSYTMNYGTYFGMNFYVGNHPFTMVILVKSVELIESTRTIMSPVMDSYVWLDSMQNDVVNESFDLSMPDLQRELKRKLFYNHEIIRQDNGYLFMHSLSNKWIFAAFMSDRTLLFHLGTPILALGITFFCLIGLTILLNIPLLNVLLKPLKRLTQQMRKDSITDLSEVKMKIRRDEIGELTLGFNNMVVELRNHITKLIQKENLEQSMKHKLLMTEINPHFVYNTMNSINYLARKKRMDDIVKINTALIRILQDKLQIDQSDMLHSIEMEKLTTEQYFSIQSIYFNNLVSLNWCIPDDMLGLRVPRSILQPLVENALKHGFTDREGEPTCGKININMHTRGNEIVVSVLDDGVGIDEEVLNTLNYSSSIFLSDKRSMHVGIRNLKERLTFIYGSAFSVLFSSRYPHGLEVTLTFPLQPKDE